MKAAYTLRQIKSEYDARIDKRDRMIELLTEDGFDYALSEGVGGTNSTAWTSAFYCSIEAMW